MILLMTNCSKEDALSSQKEYPSLPTEPYDYKTPPVNISSGYSISSNPTTDAGGALGRVLFYDKKLSLNNTVSCGSCHKQAQSFSDGKQFSKGFQGQQTMRNAPALVNLLSVSRYFWDRRVSTLEELALRPVENHIEMGIEDLDKLSPKLSQYDYYPPLFKEAFGTSEITPELISNALAQFMRSMVSFDSKFDNATGGSGQFSNLELTNPEVYTHLEEKGFELFFSSRTGCSSCHSGGSGRSFGGGSANIGLDMDYKDNGMGARPIVETSTVNGTLVETIISEGNEEFNGIFKVPTLRNIALTAPYMHDGRFNTLEEVIDHYSNGVKAHKRLDPRLMDPASIVNIDIWDNEERDELTEIVPQVKNYTEFEKRALVAFLETLTDQNYVTNPKFSNPFDY